MDYIVQTLLTAPPESRFERKFHLSQMTLKQFEFLLYLHPACFREIYSQRPVNNVYLDDLAYSHYFANVYGNNERKKVRVRWYGALWGKVQEPVLEIKVKRNFHGFKRRFNLPAFTLERQRTLLTLPDLWRQAELPEVIREHMKELKPSLLNRYQRRYFLSANGTFRLTVDSDLEYYAVSGRNAFLGKSHEPGIIVELKYPPQEEPAAAQVINQFPFRISRMSKYINGRERAYF